MPEGTLKAILTQANISVSDFLEKLKFQPFLVSLSGFFEKCLFHYGFYWRKMFPKSRN